MLAVASCLLGYDDVAAYDPMTDTWETLPSMDVPRSLHTAMTPNDGTATYVVGGSPTCGELSSPFGGFIKFNGGSSWEKFTVEGLTPAFNMGAVAVGTSNVLVFGGATFQFEALSQYGFGDPANPSGWTLGSCATDLGTGCQRSGPFDMYEDGSIIQVLGGNFAHGNAPTVINFDPASPSWSLWTVKESPYFTYWPYYGAPSFSGDLGSANGGPVRAITTDRRRIYLDSSGYVHILNMDEFTWMTDPELPLTDYCSEGPAVWINGEMIQYSGNCAGVLSAIGAKYQPPAPGWTP